MSHERPCPCSWENVVALIPSPDLLDCFRPRSDSDNPFSWFNGLLSLWDGIWPYVETKVGIGRVCNRRNRARIYVSEQQRQTHEISGAGSW